MSEFPLSAFRQAVLNLNEKTRWEQVRYAYSVAPEASSSLSQSKTFTNWSHEGSSVTCGGLGLWNRLLLFFCYLETGLFILLPYLYTCIKNRSKCDFQVRQT